MGKGYRILICEPDAKSRQASKVCSAASMHKLVCCKSSSEAILLLDGKNIDAAILCLDADGSLFEVFDWIDKSGCNIPILITTPRNALELRLLGLERGAADYLIRPFSMNELVIRVSTVLRRLAHTTGHFSLRGGLKLNMETGYFGNCAKWITLTLKERQAFSLLLECGDRPVSRSLLKDAIAKNQRMSDNALEVVIHRLRAKTSQYGINIRAFRGSGYFLEYS